MKILKNKFAGVAIAVFFILSMTASMTLMSFANSQTLESGKISIPLKAYCNVAPNPIGLGQEVNVGFWLNLPPPTASGPFGDRWGNITVSF